MAEGIPETRIKNAVAGIFHSLGSVLGSFVRLIFPRLCGVCGRGLVGGERFLCTACLADFPFSDDVFTSEIRLLATFDDSYRPEKFHSLFYYNKYDNYRHLVYAIKYHSRKDLGVYLGHMLGNRIKGKTDADCIVPVPLHPKREKSRGYNQSRQIAIGVAEVLGIEIIDDVVIRACDNKSQTGRNVEERRKNVENIFRLEHPEKIKGKHILLIDDVVTTGATIRSCLQVMSGAENVRFSLACLARTTD